MTYIIISSILFVFSIIFFFIKNGNKQLTFRQIIKESFPDVTKKPFYKRYPYPDLFLLGILAVAVTFFHFSFLIILSGSLFIYFLQKMLILLIQRTIFKCRIKR